MKVKVVLNIHLAVTVPRPGLYVNETLLFLLLLINKENSYSVKST